MVQLKTVLDKRRQKIDGGYPIVFRITEGAKVNTVATGISVTSNYWDESKNEILKIHPNFQSLNTTLSKKYYLIQKSILKLEEDGLFVEYLEACLGVVYFPLMNLNY